MCIKFWYKKKTTKKKLIILIQISDIYITYHISIHWKSAAKTSKQVQNLKSKIWTKSPPSPPHLLEIKFAETNLFNYFWVIPGKFIKSMSSQKFQLHIPSSLDFMVVLRYTSDSCCLRTFQVVKMFFPRSGVHIIAKKQTMWIIF